jgi:hypothetical protein
MDRLQVRLEEMKGSRGQFNGEDTDGGMSSNVSQLVSN